VTLKAWEIELLEDEREELQARLEPGRLDDLLTLERIAERRALKARLEEIDDELGGRA
jgi:hypothetical protein